VKSGLLKIGCCGFPFPKTKYAKTFSTAEVQQTFYQPPQISTLQRWRELVPADFEYTLKAWQLITHGARSPTYRRLKTKLTKAELDQCGSFQFTPPVLRAWEASCACAAALRARNILLQCPASFTASSQNIAQLRHFFSSIERHGLRLLWEPRGDWTGDLIQSLCAEFDLIHAVDPFVSQTVTPKFIYFRLHGGKGFKHIFTDVELKTLSAMIPRDKPAYVLFNNITMWDDALRFAQLCRL
jgi:uncharacterized protein YecE (DUF72 family)